ncbi:tail fiber domain-containing protein [Enterococcus faecium]|nr:tail fiber domain-containing protein [Enterococcus faecium]
MRVVDDKTKKESMTFGAERGQYISLSSKGTDGIYYRQIHIDGSTGEVSMNNLTMNGVIKDGGLSNFYASKKFWVPNNVDLDFYSNLNMNGFAIQNQSDIRLKENIEPTQVDGISETKKLDFYEFDRKQNYQTKDETLQPNSDRELGLIAQYTPFLAEQSTKDHYLRLNMSKQVMLNSLTNKQLIEKLEKLEKNLVFKKKNRRKYHHGGI